MNNSASQFDPSIGSRYYKFSYYFFKHEGTIFFSSLLLGVVLAVVARFLIFTDNLKEWRLLFLIYPLLFSFSLVACSIGLLKLTHLIAGTKLKPIGLSNLSDWENFKFSERSQAIAMPVVAFLCSTAIGWVLGVLVSLFWRK